MKSFTYDKCYICFVAFCPNVSGNGILEVQEVPVESSLANQGSLNSMLKATDARFASLRCSALHGLSVAVTGIPREERLEVIPPHQFCRRSSGWSSGEKTSWEQRSDIQRKSFAWRDFIAALLIELFRQVREGKAVECAVFVNKVKTQSFFVFFVEIFAVGGFVRVSKQRPVCPSTTSDLRPRRM